MIVRLLPAWTTGRQGTGYFKRKLAECRFPIPWDLYVLKYPPGASVPEHRDPVDHGRHYRLNVELQQAEDGGMFVLFGDEIYWRPRVTLFRPDIHTHLVTPVLRGTRYVLSIGWVVPSIGQEVRA